MSIATIAAYGPGPWHDGAWHGGPPPFWPIFPVIWILVVAGIVTAFVVIGRRSRRNAPSRAGEVWLAERFAAGDIDEEEFRARRAVLREQ